ncbi:MAG: hypothetical protein WCV83_01190 [Candidatus Magasanikbacteria bacterium]|jgi:hypothetical protein
MIENQPDITLEQAIRKTKDAGITLNFDKGQTVAGDLFQLQQDIRKTNSTIEHIKWVFGAILIGSVFATIVLLADYANFASTAYIQFNQTIEEQNKDHETVESIKTDIEFIKNNLNSLNSGKK